MSVWLGDGGDSEDILTTIGAASWLSIGTRSDATEDEEVVEVEDEGSKTSFSGSGAVIG